MNEVKVPEGYKQTEVGVIPKDWGVSLLMDITIDMLQGINTAIDKPEYVYAGVPILKANNVIDQVISLDDADQISYKSYLKYNQRYSVKRNDFLFSNIGARLGTGALWESDITATFAWNVMRIIPDPRKVSPKFLAQLINSPKQSEKIQAQQSGSGMGFVPKATMQKLLLPLPKLKEQTAIATALSDVDNLIQSLEKLIAKKEAIKTGTMQQLLTGKTRLPEFATREDGSAKGFKQTELGRIPEDWDLVELRDLLSYEQPTKYIINGNEFLEDGTTPILTAGKSFILGYTEETHGIYRNLPTIIFDDFTTATQFVNFPFKVKSSAMKILKPKSTSVPIQLIYLLLSNIEYKVGDHKRHWISEFSSLKVRLPNSSLEQTAIATILSDMDAEIQALQQRLEKTKDIKQGMMQQLLTGKVRLAH